MTQSRTWKQGALAVAAALLTSLSAGGLGHAAPPVKLAEPKPKAGPTCSLRTTEAPRGGRLEVERTETSIAVQIHADSDGGEVTVQVGSLRVPCGTLTIVGKNE